MGTCLVVQWLRLQALNAAMSLIPGQGTKIPYATQSSLKKKKKKSTNGVANGFMSKILLESGLGLVQGTSGR